MPAAPIPPDEPDRLAALACLAILDTPPEERFDRITRVAAALFCTSIAAINLVDANCLWTKSGVGLAPGTMARDISYCSYVVHADSTVIVPDMHADARMADLPLTAGAPFLRFYAGVPLRSASGHVLGTLCLADPAPRVLMAEEEARLHDLAVWAERELTTTELHEALRRQQQSDARFRAAAEAMLDAFFIFESVRDAAGQITDFRFVYINERAQSLVTLPRAMMQGQLLCELLPINRTGGFFDRYVQVVETQTPLEEEFQIDTPEVMSSWIHHQVVPLGDGIAITSRDVTARRLADATIAATNDRLTTMVHDLETRARTLTLLHELSDLLHGCDTLADALDVIALSAQELFPGTSGALYVQQFGSGDLALGPAWGVPFGAEPAQYARASNCASIAAPVVVRGETLGLLHILDHSSSCDAALGHSVQRDLARAMADQIGMALANIRLREELRHQAVRDALTGLYNRRYLDETFERELARAERQSRPASVLVVDIDHFKRFNDTWGHAAGDIVLRAVGQLLARSVRGSDIAARAGGEEFVLVLPDSALHDAAQRAEQLRVAARSLQVAHAPPLPPITISVGVASFPNHGLHAAELLQVADEALYAAKNAGRDRVCVAPEAPIEQLLVQAPAITLG